MVPAMCSKIFSGRLLNLCLVQQHGVKEMAELFGCSNLSEAKLSEGGSGNVSRGSLLKDVFQVAQLVVSIPDRAGLKAPIALESPYPFFQMCSVAELYLFVTCLSRQFCFSIYLFRRWSYLRGTLLWSLRSHEH